MLDPRSSRPGDAPGSPSTRLVSAVAVAGLLLLLAILAALQYRWLGEAALADRARAENGLRRAAERFADDYHRELRRTRVDVGRPEASFDVSAGEILDSWDRWRDGAEVPSLVSGIARVRVDAEGASVERLDVDSVSWVAVDDPALLRGLRRQIVDSDRQALLEDPLALLVPTAREASARRGRSRSRSLSRPERRARARARLRDGDLGSPLARERGRLRVLLLDADSLEETIPEALAARYFRRDGQLEARLRLVDEKSGRTLWRAGRWDDEATGNDGPPADVVVDIFDFPRFDRPSLDGPRFREQGQPERATLRGAESLPAWRLEVWPRGGTLDEAVARARRRSLTLSFGVLLVLAVAIVSLAWSERRARRLAARQLDFVAGVTHELLTPLAALRSAGQNLSDGVVTDPQQVARYGRLVDREGGRLATMVQQLLGYAATTRGTRPDLVSVDVERAIERSLESLAPAIEAAGARVTVDVDDGLPRASADPATLESALGNLVGNALKHGRGADGTVTIEIRARPDRGPGRGPGSPGLSGLFGKSGTVRIDVDDHGPGVAPADRKSLFEPFVRGRGKTASALPGAGLGLALVDRWLRAMGGRVRFAPRPGGGARFTLILKRSPPEAIEP